MATRTQMAWAPDRGELITHLPHAQGKGASMKHAMLVISPRLFSQRTGIVFGFPMEHSQQHADNPFAVQVSGPADQVGYVLVHRPQSIDWRAGNARPHSWGAGTPKLITAVLQKFDAIFVICQH